MRSEEEVDAMIEDMIQRTKSNYIFQSVAFNKNSPKQLLLLKKALMSSDSFSGLCKEIIGQKFNGTLHSPLDLSKIGIQKREHVFVGDIPTSAPISEPKFKETSGKSGFIIK